MNYSAIPYYLGSFQTILKGFKKPLSLATLAFAHNQEYRYLVTLSSGERFQVESLLDAWVIKETVLDRQYEVASIALQPDWTVIDIGAAFGDYTVWAARQLPQGRVVAAEPFPATITMLEANLKLNGIDNSLVIPKAVSGHTGRMDLHLVGKSTVRHSAALPSSSRESLSVEAITLTGLLGLSGIDRCDYLKMDCEGAEFAILFNTKEAELRAFPRICMEVHDGFSEYSRGDMIRFLEEMGYKTRITPNPVHRSLALLYAWYQETD